MRAHVNGGTTYLASARAPVSIRVLADVITVEIGSFSSLPQTVNDDAITGNHVAILCTPSTPTAMVGEWTVSTSDGSLTIDGEISGSTTLQLVLIKNGLTI